MSSSRSELLSRVKILFLIDNIPAKRNGITTSVIRKVKMIEDNWNYRPLIITMNYNLDLRKNIKELVDMGQLNPTSLIFNMYEHFQGTTTKRQCIENMKDDKLIYNEVTKGTYEVYDGVKHVRTETKKKLNDVFKKVVTFRNDATIDYVTFHDDLGYLSKKQIFNNDDKKNFIQEQFFDIEGTCKITINYRVRNNKNTIQEIILNMPSGTKTFKSELDLFIYYINEIIEDDNMLYFLIAERIRLSEVPLRISKNNVIKTAVLHSAFLTNPNDLSGEPSTLHSVVCKRLNEFDGIVALTNQEKKDLEIVASRYCNHNNDNVYVISHAYPVPFVENDFYERDLKKVVAVARFCDAKRLDLAVRIFGKVIKKVPDAIFEIYGFGSSEEKAKIEKTIAEVEAENNIIIKGYTSNPYKVFQSAAMSLSTSKYEGFPLTILESLANGCPVISYDIKYGPPDQIEDDFNGYLFPFENIDEYSDKIVELLNNKEKLSELSKNAFKKASIEFSIDKYLDDWYSFIESMVYKHEHFKIKDEKLNKAYCNQIGMMQNEHGSLIGYTSGVFDLFHIGHLSILKNARAMCDKLIVGVTVDELVEYKGKKAIIPYSDRAEIVRSVRYVDAVVPQENMDKLAMCKKLKANVLFVGDDWYGTEKWESIENDLAKEGISVIYFPYTKGISSTKIKATLNTDNDDEHNIVDAVTTFESYSMFERLLRITTDFQPYIELLSEMKNNITIIITIKDSVQGADISVPFESLGLKTNFAGTKQRSYIAVVDKGLVAYEAFGKAPSENLEVIYGSYTATSKSYMYGNTGSVIKDKKELSQNKRGFNIVVLQDDNLVDSICYDVIVKVMYRNAKPVSFNNDLNVLDKKINEMNEQLKETNDFLTTKFFDIYTLSTGKTKQDFFYSMSPARGRTRKIHMCLLYLLREFDWFCKQAGAKYIIHGGTMLGAFRHNGFIPWDDDLDIVIAEDDLNKLWDYFDENEETVLRERGFSIPIDLGIASPSRRHLEISPLKFRMNPFPAFLDIFVSYYCDTNDNENTANAVATSKKIAQTGRAYFNQKTNASRKYHRLQKKDWIAIAGEHLEDLKSVINPEKTKNYFIRNVTVQTSRSPIILSGKYLDELTDYTFEDMSFPGPADAYEFLTTYYKGDIYKLPLNMDSKYHIVTSSDDWIQQMCERIKELNLTFYKKYIAPLNESN